MHVKTFFTTLFILLIFSLSFGEKLLMREGNKITWNAKESGPLVGANLLVFLDNRSLEQKKTDLENIRSLGSNLVRLNVLPGEWRERTEETWTMLEGLTDYAYEQGLFSIIDYHAIGTPEGSGEDPWWANIDSIYDTDWDLALTFWKEAAIKYKDKGWVIFEIWNEPVDLDNTVSRDLYWPNIVADYWQELIDTIRAQDASNFILAAGGHWARNLINYEDAPLIDLLQNFGFAYHEYQWGEPQNADMFLNGLADSFPIIGTEWGLRKDMETPTRDAFITYEKKYLDQKFVGWTAWAYAVDSDPSMLSSYEPMALNAFGSYVQTKLNDLTITSRPNDAAPVTGKMQASIPIKKNRHNYRGLSSNMRNLRDGTLPYDTYDLQGRLFRPPTHLSDMQSVPTTSVQIIK